MSPGVGDAVGAAVGAWELGAIVGAGVGAGQFGFTEPHPVGELLNCARARVVWAYLC